DRTNRQGKTFVGLVKGFHLRAGAIASSEAWDTSDIIVVGAGDADMAVAVNRVHALRGGAVVCVNGEIVAELPLPVLGIISDMPMERLAQRLEEIKVAASHLGITFPDPLLTLSTLTTAAIPHLRICEEGLVNLRYDKTLGLFLE
ncbi:MAG: adenine deaminase C-terminal domain-containing protein, partial [Thermodesulfobacteriota bacterium]|nr:adenine deaminase C-terminal domain-containing protein [Thermodesulfobacteriota bacterium]